MSAILKCSEGGQDENPTITSIGKPEKVTNSPEK